MSKAKVAATHPYEVEVEKGKDYYWCACGLSKSQPFCNGSHKVTEFSPKKFTAEASATVYFCGCKQSKHAPLCDGSHKALSM
ncbi:MAG: CDGSH iron-sulfur domain-containing protein [Georgfuchsia sp.]